MFSYSKDAVVKLWELDKATIIQTIGLHFPSFSVLGKEIEFGRPGMYVEAGTADTVLVICCEHLTELRILEESQASCSVITTEKIFFRNEKLESKGESCFMCLGLCLCLICCPRLARR